MKGSRFVLTVIVSERTAVWNSGNSRRVCRLSFSPDVKLASTKIITLTFRHRASSIEDRRFATLQRTLFMFLINKYISLSDICLTVHHWYK
jgi:hypothetical protein